MKEVVVESKNEREETVNYGTRNKKVIENKQEEEEAEEEVKQ